MRSELNEVICADGERTLVRRLSGTVDLNIKISEVILMGDGTDSWNTVLRVVLGCDFKAQDRVLGEG